MEKKINLHYTLNGIEHIEEGLSNSERLIRRFQLSDMGAEDIMNVYAETKKEKNMKITYEPEGINSFHNSAPINLVITGKTLDADNGELYLITRNQAKRIEKHFCGIKDCRCPAGAAIQLDTEGAEYGIRTKYCSPY